MPEKKLLEKVLPPIALVSLVLGVSLFVFWKIPTFSDTSCVRCSIAFFVVFLSGFSFSLFLFLYPENYDKFTLAHYILGNVKESQKRLKFIKWFGVYGMIVIGLGLLGLLFTIITYFIYNNF